MAGITLLSLGFGSCIITERDKLRIVQEHVAKFVERYSDAEPDESDPAPSTPLDQLQFIVVCDFLPLDASISSDPRARRIRMDEFEALRDKLGYDRTRYLVLELKQSTSFSATFEVSHLSGDQAGGGHIEIVRKFLFRFSTEYGDAWAS